MLKIKAMIIEQTGNSLTCTIMACFFMCTTYAGSNYRKQNFLFFLVIDAKRLDQQLGGKMPLW